MLEVFFGKRVSQTSLLLRILGRILNSEVATNTGF